MGIRFSYVMCVTQCGMKMYDNVLFYTGLIAIRLMINATK